MIVVSLAANLLLENFVEPRVMSRSLDLHPIMVVVVLALGGMLGGIIGLIVAVPAAAVARSAYLQLRTTGYVDELATKARPVRDGLPQRNRLNVRVSTRAVRRGRAVRRTSRSLAAGATWRVGRHDVA